MALDIVAVYGKLKNHFFLMIKKNIMTSLSSTLFQKRWAKCKQTEANQRIAFEKLASSNSLNSRRGKNPPPPPPNKSY